MPILKKRYFQDGFLYLQIWLNELDTTQNFANLLVINLQTVDIMIEI